jgi:LDH2 family malate/lactate/ureidoglycolate dehydrogenase
MTGQEVQDEWVAYHEQLARFDDQTAEFDRQIAAMTSEQRAAWDESQRVTMESEMRAERYNEYALEGIDLGPSEDDAYERYLESLEEFE